MKTNFEELKVTELKELCRKANIKGYSRMKKSELIDALKNSQELKKQIKLEAMNRAKEELGHDFQKAVTFWKQLKGLDKLKARDYDEVVTNWKLLQGLLEVHKGETTINSSLMDIAQYLGKTFGVKHTEISQYNETQLKDFISDTLEYYNRSVNSELLHKETYSILKLSLADMNPNPKGFLYFDSTKASILSKGNFKVVDKTKMREVETAEDGISRMLENRGFMYDEDGNQRFNEDGSPMVRSLKSITVFIGETSSDEDQMKRIMDKKRNLFMHGVWDISCGKHYMPAFQNPSSCRKGNFTFVEVSSDDIEKSWDEIFDLWYEITGTKDATGFTDAFGNEVVLAKLLARISTRGSNSFNISNISPECAERIAKANVLYCPDAHQEINRPYKNIDSPGVTSVKEGKRTVTPGDGQGYVSLSMAIEIAVAMRVITGSEYDELLGLWKAHLHKKGSLASVVEGSRLWKLINKVPKVWQIRHGEKKGLLVVADIETCPNGTLDGKVVELSKYDIIIPDSVRKFIGGEWSEYPLEICNYLKKKKNLVALNPQFIEALGFEENPNALNTIVDYWFDYMKESLTDINKGQQFHNIAKTTDVDNPDELPLAAALRTSSDLLRETQVCKWRKEQYAKFISDMKIGRIFVPGQYTYQVCDPAYVLNNIFGIDLPCLAYGEFYHNGKECKAGLFRSPMLHPAQAQKVQLVNFEAFWYLADTIVFNGFDGVWDRMSGSDFDGDTCAVITDDTKFGKLIVDNIREFDYDIWEEALKAKVVHFSRDNMTAFFDYAQALKPDRTGVMTNYNTKSLGISNHLRSAIYFAKLLKCETITLLHPTVFGNDGGHSFIPCSGIDSNGKKTFQLRGFVEAKWNPDVRKLEYSPVGFVGTFSFEEIEKIADYYFGLCEITTVLQAREIDGAKTGVYAEGISGNDYIDAVKTPFCPHYLMTRQDKLGREISMTSKNNSFVSLSPLARMHDYVCKREPEIMDFLENGSHMSLLLQTLITEEEAAVINNKYLMSNGSCLSLIEFMNIRKSAYNQKIYEIKKALTDDDESRTKIREEKENEIQALHDAANILNVSLECIAVAGYIATYNKDNKQNEGLTYAWLLSDELLSVFSRANKKFERFKLPANAEYACILNKVLYVNGHKYIDIDAEDCQDVVIDFHGNRPYALIHKNVPVIAKPRTTTVVYGANVYTIGTSGFKYHIAECDDFKAEWKRIVIENNYHFDIVMQEGRAVLMAKGKSISALMEYNASIDLIGKKVKMVNKPSVSPIVESEASIKNIQVVIVGEADC